VVPALRRSAAEASPVAVASVGGMALCGRDLKDTRAEALAATLPQFSGLISLESDT